MTQKLTDPEYNRNGWSPTIQGLSANIMEKIQETAKISFIPNMYFSKDFPLVIIAMLVLQLRADSNKIDLISSE